jgi:hypothetical protein
VLGDLLGESTGKILGTRVLPTESGLVKLEVSFQGSGKFLGEDLTDIGTYWQIVKPGGLLYGEGHVLMMAGDGGIGDWTGFGVGRSTGPAGASHYAVCGLFHSMPERWSKLLKVAAVNEFDTDSTGGYHWKMWEWK